MNPEIDNARNEYQSATKTAGDLAAGQYNVEGAIKNKLMDAYEYNKDIIEPLDQATSSYMTAPSDARVKYQDIFNPFQREQLVSQYTQNQAIPMLTLSNILGLRQGSIADQINAGVGGYQAKVAAAQNQAALAQQNYDNLIREYEAETSRMGKSGGGGSSLLSSLFSGSGLGTPPKKGTLSDQGEWVFNGTDWEPVAGGSFTPTEPKPANTGKGSSDLNSALALAVLTGDISASEAKYVSEALGVSGKRAEETMEVGDLLGRLTSMRGELKGIGSGDLFSYKTKGIIPGFGQGYKDVSDFITKRNLIGMEVTRMFESGVLTDQDRNFYLNNFPTDADIIANPEFALYKMDSVINYFSEKYGLGDSISGGNNTDDYSGEWEVIE